MTGSRYEKKNRILAWMAAMAIVFVMLFSVLYIVEHAQHHCTGENCPICERMQQCMQNVKQLGTAAVIVVAVMAVSYMIEETAEHVAQPVVDHSLISQKVRMDN
ncbi:MAG: AraC family transcriptional regulator [Eubacterium sp.]|nr:AraC family transcriptional regulator [Eubacterium sp.]